MAAPNPALETGTRFTPRFDAQGLIPAIAVDARDGAVLMLAYMNQDAIDHTLATGEVHYWSRSRQALWHKGATSGEIQRLVEMRVDCDQDALVVVVEQQGGKCCHVGYRACFYRAVADDGGLRFIAEPVAQER